MRLLQALLPLVLATLTLSLPAQILQLADLNSPQVAALDRAHTVLLLTDGILEEHGPYLPLFTDGYWDQAVTEQVARIIVARPGWTALVAPTLPLGTNTANVIGGRFTFPGSFPVRSSTLREVFMDLADSVGQQGFRHVFIIDSHGGPLNSVVLDQAAAYFNDTYRGHMVHLLGLMPANDCCKALEEALTPAKLKANGLSLHADTLEQSQGLFLTPQLVPDGYRSAPTNGGTSIAELMHTASQPDWPGYLGAPSFATAALGARYFDQLTAVLKQLVPDLLDGKADAAKLPRYADLILPQTTAIETPQLAHEEELAAHHRQWLAAHAPAATRPH